ncbi:two-component system, chemotaxis family, CheB/CheR fusion protein [Mariprofundus micogutta]|uniref:histidine kinase n=1 Tax=Mariprofundus micogutta TaxID=1921010 RepID=A0A1L8CKH4_9PROT|nr:ATP-binding protein [Mariprofundus micogutta]GAV19406.1 two-component system, chemotaxis family, CheB/CheR fusion protein [Mariprofundus micogutta]
MQESMRARRDIGMTVNGWFVAALFLLLASLLSWFSLNAIRSNTLEAVQAEMQALNHWVDSDLASQGAEMTGEIASLISENMFLNKLAVEINGAGTADSRFNLRRDLAAWMVSHEYRDFFVFDASGILVAGMRDAELGNAMPEAVSHHLHAVMSGSHKVTHPFATPDGPRMWVMLPVTDNKGAHIGVFALELAESRHFSVTTVKGRSGKSSETYLVSREGLLLSSSRFESDLRDVGLLKPAQSSVLAIRAADPGALLTKAQPLPANMEQWPLTHAVDGLLKHPDGADMQGYRDYRGVRVFGVWQWDRMLDLGIITEVDADEALSEYYHIRNLLLTLLAGLIIIAVILLRGYSHYRSRLEYEAAYHKDLLLESTAEAIYGIDPQGCCTFANKSCVRLLGFDNAEQLLGKNMHALVHHTHPDGTPYEPQSCHIMRSFHQKTRVYKRDEVFWRRDGSSFPVEYWSHPVFDGDETIGCVVTFLDISELRDAERQRSRIEKQVQHAQRLESLGILAGGIAHDFNNILSAILGNAALAQRRVVNDPVDAKEKLEKIVQSCDRASVLCRQMLAYSGKGKFVVRPLNLSDSVEEITHLLEVSLEKGVVLKYSLAESLPAVEADEAQIQQLIMNLVTNANEAIGKKSGVISISTGVMQADSSYLLDCFGDNPVQGRYAYVEVNDTGCGMDAETRDKIFDPFFTTKFTGRGLGMSAVLGIVRGHKGALKLYSELGRGTSFKFLLPVSGSGVLDQTVELSRHDLWHGHGLIMVVDDEETVRETAIMMLEDMGFTTIGVENGVQALDVYRQRGSGIAGVLMDLTMPKMGGEECFSELRRINPDIKVVLTSGYNEQDAIQHFTGKRLAAFIQKPVSPDRLREVMHKVMEDEA